jgi:acyl carrier protein
MAADITVERVCAIVEQAILIASNKDTLSAPVGPQSRMGSPREWDSLSFVVVFNAISEAFEVELEDDDAIQLTSIPTMVELLQDIAA